MACAEIRAAVLLPNGPRSRDSTWSALEIAEQCANLPGLTPAERLTVLGDAGHLRVKVGDYAGAERAFRRALELKPSDAESSLRLAQVLREWPEEALPHARKAAAGAVEERRRVALRLLGAIQRDLGDDAGARESFASALALHAGDLDALWAMAGLLRDRPAESSVHALRASQAAEAAPMWYRPAALRLCARGWLELKNFPKALASAKSALELAPDNRDALRLLLRAMRERDRDKAAGGVPSSNEETSAAEETPAPGPDPLEQLRESVERKRRSGDRKGAATLADQFTAAILDAPEWQQLSAYHEVARLWLELEDKAKARLSAQWAQRLDWTSLENALLIYELLPKSRDSSSSVLARSYSAAAREQMYLGYFERAETNAKRALEFDPQDAGARKVLDGIPSRR